MKIRVPSYFKDFKCIASECEDTCCAGWGIVIDEETYHSYQNIESEFGDKVRSKIVKEDGEDVFVLNGDDCPFLNTNNLCEIYKELGEQYLCYTCKQYPRYMEELLDLREMGISLSCPEAARIILGNCKATEFEVTEDDEAGEVDERIAENDLEDILLCRNMMIDLMEMTHIALEARAAIVLRFAEEIQDKIYDDEMDDIKYLREKYSQSGYIEQLVNELDHYKGNEAIKYQNVHAYFKTYRDLEHINENDPLGLNHALKYFGEGEEDRAFYIEKHRAFNAYYQENMYKFKNILVYFIFRYLMKAVYDYDVASKIKLAIMSTLMIKELAVVRWIEKGEFTEVDMVDISHMYSKDIEHLEENIDTLQDIFEVEEIYQADQIIVTLMNAF